MRRFYAAYTDSKFLTQPAAEIGSPALNAETLCEVPWGHHLLLLDKVSDSESRQYHLRATVRYGWTRNVLLNQIKASAYERSLKEGKAHNFSLALPERLTEQAEKALKSSYNLEFLGIDREVREREKERTADDQPSIGIILCAEKDDVVVEFSLKSKTNPIGVAEYQLTDRLPKELGASCRARRR